MEKNRKNLVMSALICVMLLAALVTGCSKEKYQLSTSDKKEPKISQGKTKGNPNPGGSTRITYPFSRTYIQIDNDNSFTMKDTDNKFVVNIYKLEPDYVSYAVLSYKLTGVEFNESNNVVIGNLKKGISKTKCAQVEYTFDRDDVTSDRISMLFTLKCYDDEDNEIYEQSSAGIGYGNVYKDSWR